MEKQIDLNLNARDALSVVKPFAQPYFAHNPRQTLAMMMCESLTSVNENHASAFDSIDAPRRLPTVRARVTSILNFSK